MISVEDQAKRYAEHMKRTGQNTVTLFPARKSPLATSNEFIRHLAHQLLKDRGDEYRRAGTRAYGWLQTKWDDNLRSALEAAYTIRTADLKDYDPKLYRDAVRQEATK